MECSIIIKSWNIIEDTVSYILNEFWTFFVDNISSLKKKHNEAWKIAEILQMAFSCNKPLHIIQFIVSD